MSGVYTCTGPAAAVQYGRGSGRVILAKALMGSCSEEVGTTTTTLLPTKQSPIQIAHKKPIQIAHTNPPKRPYNTDRSYPQKVTS